MNSSLNKRIFGRAVTWFVGLLTAVLGLLLLCVPQPHLFPSGTRVDLGDVGVGETREKAFFVSNHSSLPITIVGWTPTCHCIQANFPQAILLPGQSVKAYVETTGSAPLGTHAAVIAIQWHFAGESFVRADKLVVSAKYISPISLSEQRLDFGSLSLSGMETKTLNIVGGNTDNKWNSLQVVADSGHLSAQVQPTSSGFQVQTQIHPQGLPIGIWKSELKIFTLRDGVMTGRAVDVPVVARIKGPFSAYPPVLRFLEHSDLSLSFTFKVHSSTVPIRNLRILGNLVQFSKVVIAKEGMDATVTGVLANPTNNEIAVGKIPIEVNDAANVSLQLSFICYPD